MLKRNHNYLFMQHEANQFSYQVLTNVLLQSKACYHRSNLKTWDKKKENEKWPQRECHRDLDSMEPIPLFSTHLNSVQHCYYYITFIQKYHKNYNYHLELLRYILVKKKIVQCQYFLGILCWLRAGFYVALIYNNKPSVF